MSQCIAAPSADGLRVVLTRLVFCFLVSLAQQMAAGCELMNAAGKKRGRREGDKGRREGDRGCKSSLNDVLLKVRARSLRWQQPWRTVQTGKVLREIWLIGRSYRRKAERMLGGENPLLHQSLYLGERSLTCRCDNFIPDRRQIRIASNFLWRDADIYSFKSAQGTNPQMSRIPK